MSAEAQQYAERSKSAAVYPNVSSFVKEVCVSSNSDWSEIEFKNILRRIIENFGVKSVLEVGGGRCPIFSMEEISGLGVHYAISDISQNELDLAPQGLSKLCFDIAAPLSGISDKFDLIFSRKVFEHIKDAKQGYKNQCSMLNSGGIVFNFVPTLFCPPIVMNHLMPEWLSSRVLYFFQPHRNPHGEPKFKSFYKWCFASEDVRSKIKSLGFAEVEIVPFYGHHYFDNVPVLKHFHKHCRDFCAKNDLRAFASRMYLIARKP